MFFFLHESVPQPDGTRARFSRKQIVLVQYVTLLSSDPLPFQQPLDVTNHSVAREVVTFFTLPPGDYIVVPQTSVPNCDGKFLLRILTDEQSNIWEVNEDNMLFRNILAEFEESFKYVSIMRLFCHTELRFFNAT